jgi:hypothetical protein
MSMMCDVWHGLFYLYLRTSHVFDIFQSYFYTIPVNAVLFSSLICPCLIVNRASDLHPVLLTSGQYFIFPFFSFSYVFCVWVTYPGCRVLGAFFSFVCSGDLYICSLSCAYTREDSRLIYDLAVSVILIPI